MERREVALPLLVQAAGSFAVVLALALPNGLFAAAAALLVVWLRNGVALLPFLLAGQLAAQLVVAGGNDHAATTPAEIALQAATRVTRSTRSSSSGRHSTLIEFESAGDRARARATTGLLLESGLQPLRRPGDHLLVTGTLLPAGPPRNPGVRRERARLLAERVMPRAGSGAFGRLRDAIDAVANAIELRLHERLSPAAAALADALVLGRAEDLDPQFKESLRAIGAWHFLAVSGSHVALVAALAAALMAWLRVPEWARVPATLLVSVGYAFLAGGEAPALRSVIGCVGAGLVLGRRRIPSSTSWLAVAFLLLGAVEPAVATEAGFQLSFVAVLALAVAARNGAARSPKGTGTGIDLRTPLLRAGRFALAAGIATAPLTAWHFGSVALLAPLATLLLGPVVAVALTVALFTAASTALPAFTTRWFEPLLAGVDALLKVAARAGDRMPATPLHVATPPQLAVVLLVASWFALLARRPLLGCAMIGAAMVAVLGAAPRPPSLTLFAVGHGQAALVRDAERCDLFDAGSDGTLPDESLVRALHELGVERLDGLFLSHLDADHAGLAPAVLAEFAVAALLLPQSARAELELLPPATTVIAELRDAAQRHGVPFRFLAAGDREGPIVALWPPRERSFGARNEGSLALRVELASGAALLLPGDLEGFPLLEAATRIDRSVAVLLLPHHGNADPGLSALISRARPELLLASREERPFPASTLTALRACGLPWLTTGGGGAIEWQPWAPIVRGAACR